MGFYGYNVHNIFCEDDYNDKVYHTIYLLYRNKNHFDFLNIRPRPNDNLVDINKKLDNVCKNNLDELKKLRKKEFPLSYKWNPNTYNDIYEYYKFNIIPDSRFKLTTNPSLYESRFKDLAKNYFALRGDRLYYIKHNKKILIKDINKLNDQNTILKKIPFVYEILPQINELHIKYGHLSSKNLAKKFLETEYYIDSIEIITEKYTYECPECNALYYSKKIIKNPKSILDKGPRFRMLVDITYLDESYFNNKTKYKYIIDSIDHFSKYYWAYLITSKNADLVLKKIKSFICINIFQRDFYSKNPNKISMKFKLIV